MGSGIKLECKKCGFELSASLGIGFLYPNVCEEILQKMKEGVFGEEFKEDATTIPNVAIHQETSLFVCDHCGDLVVDDVIDLCALIEGKKKRDGKFCSAMDYPADISYVMTVDIGDTYRIVRSVEHKCEKCNNPLRVVKQIKRSLGALKCPKCKEKLSVGDAYCWD